MTHTYKLTGMTCGSCEAKVKRSLPMLPNVSEVAVSRDSQSAIISMEKNIPVATFQEALDKIYSITAIEHNETTEQAKSWLATYKPLLLIFGYISTVAMIAIVHYPFFNWMHGMNLFMAVFSLTFSFFKVLDLNGFAESYAMYDILAQKVKISMPL